MGCGGTEKRTLMNRKKFMSENKKSIHAGREIRVGGHNVQGDHNTTIGDVGGDVMQGNKTVHFNITLEEHKAELEKEVRKVQEQLKAEYEKGQQRDQEKISLLEKVSSLTEARLNDVEADLEKTKKNVGGNEGGFGAAVFDTCGPVSRCAGTFK